MTCRVAVVDDAPDVRTLLRTILEEEGFEIVGEGRNGAEAVDLAGREQPDVMLLDLSMPVMDGLEALPLVVEASAGTAVIVLSGFVNDDVRDKVRGLGAAGCVEKGMNLPGLLQAVRDLCPAAGRSAGRAGRSKPKASSSEGETPARPRSRSVPPSSSAGPTAEAGHPVLDADDLVPVLMHELNPSVGILRRSLEAVAGAVDAGDAAGARAPLDTARRALGSVVSLLDAFAEVRAADAGRLDVRPEPVELGEVVREAIVDLEAIATDRPIELVVEADVTARVDTGRLRQVLANLLSNAAKFSPPDAPIEVGVGAHNGHALVWVRDHGKGVPPEASEAVFRKYARLGEVPGMGLGLYIARAIARAHGGDLRLEHPDGGGARFVTHLPLA